MKGIAVLYGKEKARQILTDAITELSWSSYRSEICRSMSVRLRGASEIKVAGMLMCFAQQGSELKLNAANQFFHGPIIRYEVDEFTNDWEIDARDVGWYLTKNKGSRPYLKGEAGAELQRYIKSTGVDFRCPKLGFNLDERYGTMTHSDIIIDVLQKAYERTGYHFYVDVVRTDQSFYLEVRREGTNTRVPIFVPEQIESSSAGYTIEDTYTVVTAQKWKDDKISSAATKSDAGAIKSLGRMEEIIEVGENEKPATVAEQRLKSLSKPKQLKKITVRHEEHSLAKLRAGWLVMLKTDHVSKWIVESAQTSVKNGMYVVKMELERRE